MARAKSYFFENIRNYANTSNGSRAQLNKSSEKSVLLSTALRNKTAIVENSIMIFIYDSTIFLFADFSYTDRMSAKISSV